MEIEVARFFNPRRNLVVPNVSWGFFIHECDLFVLTQSGYGYEVEIKVSLADLKADAKKWHGHRSHKLKRLYFALPDFLLEHTEYVPERAGIIAVKPTGIDGWHVYKVREAQEQPAQAYGWHDRYKIARLGALRVFDLKQKILKLKKSQNEGVFG